MCTHIYTQQKQTKKKLCGLPDGSVVDWPANAGDTSTPDQGRSHLLGSN